MSKSTILKIIFLYVTVTGNIIPLSSQPYFTGHKEMSFTDPDRGNRVVDFHIYYPADIKGDNPPVTSVNKNAFPLLLFGHGFLMEWSAYENIWSSLVPEGYIIVFPTTEGGLSPSHDTFGQDLIFLLHEVSKLGNDTLSIFYSRIDTMNCIMGHSMGGGAGILGAATDPSVKSLITLAPAETTPSAISASAQISIPALIFAGENDCVTPPADHQIPIYNGLSSASKIFISILGGSHCQMAEANFFCNIGELSCTPQPTITRSQQHAVINRYLIPWLNFHLKGDNNAAVLFDSTISSDPEITYLKTYGLAAIEKRFEDNSGFVRVSPNPFSKKLFISLPAGSSGNFNLYDITGKKVFLTRVETSCEIQPDLLPEGIYIWSFIANSGIHSSGKIIRTKFP